MVTVGRIRSSHPGNHQLAFPNIVIRLGTRTNRTTNASIKTADARATPNNLMIPSGDGTKAPKTTAMISAAMTTTLPELRRPERMLSALSLVFAHSSCIRDTRKT